MPISVEDEKFDVWNTFGFTMILPKEIYAHPLLECLKDIKWLHMWSNTEFSTYSAKHWGMVSFNRWHTKEEAFEWISKNLACDEITISIDSFNSRMQMFHVWKATYKISYDQPNWIQWKVGTGPSVGPTGIDRRYPKFDVEEPIEDE